MDRALTAYATAGALGALLLAFGGGAVAQGTEFNLSCHADEVLVGISGRQGWWMEGIAARCRTVEPSGALGPSVRSSEYAGGTAGTLKTFDCRPGEVMVGYSGSQGDNGYVLHVREILCAPWRPELRVAGAPARASSAFDTKAAPGSPISETCRDGRTGTRLRGRAGTYLDKLIDIGCSHMAGAMPAAPAPGSGKP